MELTNEQVKQIMSIEAGHALARYLSDKIRELDHVTDLADLSDGQIAVNVIARRQAIRQLNTILAALLPGTAEEIERIDPQEYVV